MSADYPRFARLLSTILTDYPAPDEVDPDEAARSVANYPDIQDAFRRARDLLQENITDEFGDEFSVDYGFGQGTLAHIPYLSIFRSDVTTSTRRGIYIVYLFDPITDRVYLTLNQGAAEMKRFRRSEDISISTTKALEQHAAYYRTYIKSSESEGGDGNWRFDSPTLTAKLRRSDHYNAGTICYTAYDSDELSSASLKSDLHTLVETYDDFLDVIYDVFEVDLDGGTPYLITVPAVDEWRHWLHEGIARVITDSDNGMMTELQAQALVEGAEGEHFHEGDLIVAGITDDVTDFVFGIGTVTTGFDETEQSKLQAIASDAGLTTSEGRFLHVDWDPMYEGGVPISIPNSSKHLFSGHSVETLSDVMVDRIVAGIGHRYAAITEKAPAWLVDNLLSDLGLGGRIRHPQFESGRATEGAPDDIDYWDSLEIKRDRLDDFIDNPTQDTLETLLDPAYFSTQRTYTAESDLERLLDNQDPKTIAETVQTAAEEGSPETLEDEIHGLGWTKASELLRLYQPESYVMYTPRSKAGMEALGYTVPEIESEAAYLQFVEDVKEATEQFDLPDVAADVSDRPIPDWATDLDTADYLFSKHYDDDYQFELPPADVCTGEVASAPYYWVSQTNSPEEIEHEYLEAKPDNDPGHDFSRLDEGDIVFHFTEGEIIGYSEVTDTAAPTVTDDGLVCRVDVSLTEFDPPVAFADVFNYLFQPDVRLDDYYPVNYAGVNQGYLFNLSQEAGEYLLEQAGVRESSDHELLEYYRDTEGCDVWRFTASPSTVLTVLRRGVIPLSDGAAGNTNQRDQWLATDSGDLILLHAKSEEDHVDSIGSGSENGLIGAAIAGKRDQKSERWFYDEHTTLRYPYLVTLDELYVTSDLNRIAFDDPLFSLDSDEMLQEISALTTYHIPWSTVSDLAQERLDHDIPLGVGNYTNLTENHGDVADLVWELLRELAPRLQEVEPSDDLPGLLPPPAEPPRTDQRSELETELERTGQIVLFGPPGTGKTFTATRFARWWIHEQTDRPKTTRFRTVTFHPSFSYEDFMEGLTADATDGGQVEYKYKDGTFKKIVEEARSAYLQAEDPDQAPRYVLLIDEINRGNLSQIFGEAITQLEMDKRLGQPDTVTIQWAHSGESVALPPNLYLIGTMNTADRSIALVDAALRRRFGFLSFPPDYQVFVQEYDFDSQHAIRTLAEEVIATDRTQAASQGIPNHYPLLALSIRALQAINENIVGQSDLTKGKRIGHSYLLGIESETELVATWQHDILPLLEEYYFGDFDRLRKEVFNVEITGETNIDSRLFDQVNHEIARIDADDLETALSTFVDDHDFQ